MIRQLPTVTQAATAAGTTASGAPYRAELDGLYVAFNSAGTLTVTTTTAPQQTFLTLTSAGTQWYYPRVQVHSTAGAALTYDGTYTVTDKFAFDDYWQVVVNAAGTAAVTMIVDE